jgi:hypothetical protein
MRNSGKRVHRPRRTSPFARLQPGRLLGARDAGRICKLPGRTGLVLWKVYLDVVSVHVRSQRTPTPLCVLTHHVWHARQALLDSHVVYGDGSINAWHGRIACGLGPFDHVGGLYVNIVHVQFDQSYCVWDAVYGPFPVALSRWRAFGQTQGFSHKR